MESFYLNRMKMNSVIYVLFKSSSKAHEANDPAKLSLRTGKSTDRVELYNAISGADHEHIPVK